MPTTRAPCKTPTGFSRFLTHSQPQAKEEASVPVGATGLTAAVANRIANGFTRGATSEFEGTARQCQ